MSTTDSKPAGAFSSFPPTATPLSSLQEWLDLPPSSTESILQSLDSQQCVQDFWEQRTRPDGRLFGQGRKCKVVRGLLSKDHATGSALVTTVSSNHSSTSSSSSSINSATKILAATTLQIGQPSPEQPDRGDIQVHVNGTGGKNLGANFFPKPKPPSWDVLQAWLQRILEQENGNALTDSIPSQLNLMTGKAALRLVVTIQILEDGGNVMDASLLACMAAWKDTQLPQVGKDLVDVQGILYWKDEMTLLSSRMDGEAGDGTSCQDNNDYQVSLTMGIWKDPKDNTTHLLVDPSIQEEPFLDGRLTVVVGTTSGNLQVQHTGTVGLTAKDLAFAAKLAQAQADEFSSILLS